LKRLLLMVAMFIVHCSTFNVYAQITIGGNVYGGGNAGDVNGSTAVTVRAGDLNAVFGGARMANVNGNALVNIDGANASNYILINYVYGGNDIAGTISTGGTVPAVVQADATANNVDNTWNAFVRVSTKTKMVNGKEEEVDDAQKIYIGQLFGGGNGDYDYTSDDSPYKGMAQPEVDRAFLDIRGGSIVYAYGGGNNATVTDKTVIYVDNPSKVVNSIKVTDGVIDETNGTELLTPSRLKDDMGINTTFSSPTSDAFQIGRFFGGNNKAEMAIRPVWNLQRGLIRNIYSGGNRGAMTYPQGILLQIKSDQIKVDNVFGGCRMADVNPAQNKIMRERIDGVDYPEGYAARVYITGGDINNVYGGNDISGNVYGGNAVGIHASIKGSVYGGGNGSYPYTDNASLKDNEIYGDLYYGDFWTAGGYASSVKALNAFRPNAEAVSIRIGGTDEAHPTIVGGAIYCGGNSATLSSTSGTDKAQLKIGSYVIADSVFLGNNGKDMIKFNEKVVETNGNILVQEGVLRTYAKFVKADGTLVDTEQSGATKFNSMDLTDKDTFGEYMDGCAMRLEPNVVFDNKKRYGDPVDYEDYSTYFGSFYCGGNVGSMKFNDVITIDFEHKVVIYDQLVGGCNDAFVKTSDFNAAYEGGVLGNKDTNGNKLIMNLSGLKIEPKRWRIKQNDAGQYVKDENDNYVKYADPDTGLPELEWNTVGADGNPTAPVTSGAGGTAGSADLARRLIGGNVYGGCCKSGVVDGNVIINLNATLIEREKLFDEEESEEEGDEVSLYGENQTTETSYTITRRHTGVLLGEQGMDAFGKALNVFGGGKGAGTQIWGSTTVNLNTGYTFQIFGGSEEGAIGKPVTNGNYSFTYKLDENSATSYTDKYSYNADYSCYVNLKGAHPGVSMTSEDNSPDMAECEFIYGGGFLGPIAGNTVINLGKGRIFNSFAGSCNADILGHTETYIGRQVITDEDGYPTGVEEGFPWIRDYVYGGNDFGGSIYGGSTTKESVVSFSDRVREGTSDKVHSDDVLKASAYVEYTQGRTLGIFGGCYGTYNYTDDRYNAYSSKDDFTKPFMDNAFVNFRPTLTEPLKNNRKNVVGRIYGAGQGYPGDMDSDKMQNRSYVLIDIPQEMENYKKLEAFGAGAWSGLGLGTYVEPGTQGSDADAVSAIIDLIHGQMGAAYGGAYQDGVTRRTVVNVPDGSTITIGSIFGGAYGVGTYNPCDVYEANVNYSSEHAKLINDPNSDPENYKLYRGAIYGGNNNKRRTLYGRVNINSEVKMDMVKDGKVIPTNGTVYGAGYGGDSWSEYTEVNLNSGAKVYEVYGGGQAGKVYNAESVQNFINKFKPEKWPDDYPIAVKAGETFTDDDWKDAWTIGGGYDLADDVWKGPWKLDGSKEYWENTNTNLANPLVREAEMDDRDFSGLSDADKALVQNKYSTNVIINKGATVVNYAYGGGLGADALVSGTTYITLLGGTVVKDIYAAGTSGSVEDRHGAGVYGGDNRAGFVASSNAYIKGGTCRNVYGGGWEGSVGKHTKVVIQDGKQVEVNANIDDPYTNDIYGETHVVIGDLDGTDFYDGIPAIERNAYGGGEGGAVYGSTHITLRNGFIGYRRFDTQPTDDLAYIQNRSDYYQEKLHDETWIGDGTNRLYDSGCIFGGGYIDNSNVDETNVKMVGGHVRNALFGGGEIAAVGRGVIHASGENNSVRTLHGIYKAGKTNVDLFEGYVHRNVFGGGRGYNNLGEGGSLYSDGYVFGQTEVHIHGGEVGTTKELALGNGNVFGGGDIGYVYSAYEYDDNGVRKLGRGIKSGERYDDGKEGYYYKHKISSSGTFTNDADFETDGSEYIPTEDCKVLIEPHAKVLSEDPVSFTDIFYAKELPVSTIDLKYLKSINSPLLSNGSIDANGKVTAENGIKFSRSYREGEYVPTYALNTLENKSADDRWNSLDATGIIIHNAVFAGGNTSSGSSTVFANATSVFGNATASIHDVYHRDLITLGTGHTGGLYGDGNLTFVDGYRGLNITNYGTDYYSILREIDVDAYHELEENYPREAAYYELKYKCNKACTDKDGTRYTPKDESNPNSRASTITADDLLVLFMEDQNTPVQVDEDGNRVTSGGTTVLEKVGDKWVPKTEYWEENGVLPVYAGRLMNSVQRADFCGVFGSRMVMQGAQDRVPEIADFTNYTINRVREVSLNQQHSVIDDDLTLKDNPVNDEDYVDVDKAIHGNYFGIYNIVNYLGALSSDVHFKDSENGNEDVRQTTSTKDEHQPDSEGQTYYDWKSRHIKERKRNNGSSQNKVALASGVYLELTTEKSTGTGLDEKDWGYITGVIELDLINVQQGIGGGFVYAKNEHGAQTYTENKHTTLTALNKDALTRRDFTYSKTDLKEWETSGNFVHSTQTIIDDCYNVSGKYSGSDAVPAHYWYIKGSVYVYDQYISAYTGAPNAYSETVDIPLTITAASHGTMRLLNVKPNKYAYYSNGNTMAVIEDGKKVMVNDVAYYKNDPISYWDWYLLSNSEKNQFVDETYVTIAECMIGETTYPAGTVLLPGKEDGSEPGTYYALKKANQKVYHVEKQQEVDFDFVFRSSNNLSHDTGYILTYKVNNPTEWDTWYTKFNSSSHEKNQEGYDVLYNNGPTYYLNSGTGGVLGQRFYEVGNLIAKNVEDTYQDIMTDHPGVTFSTEQAEFEPAYIVTSAVLAKKKDGTEKKLNPGAPLVKSDYVTDESTTLWDNIKSSVAPAYICTSTIQLSKTEYIYINTSMTGAEKDAYIHGIDDEIEALGIDADHPTATEIDNLSAENKKKLTSLQAIKDDINEYIVPAYYCTKEGDYGGNYYESGYNYRALEAFSSMTKADRDKFTFNYDAFDLLIDPTYSDLSVKKEGMKYQYDGEGFETEDDAKTNPAGYSVTKRVDYTAEYNSESSMGLGTGNEITVKRPGSIQPVSTATIQKGDELSREVFEGLVNEQRHYAPISPKADDLVNGVCKVYVVNSSFQIGNTPYAVGQTISASDYSSLGNSSDADNVTVIEFTSDDVGKTFYYCRESYTIATDGHQVKSIKGGNSSTYAKGSTVDVGAVIGADDSSDTAGTYYGFKNLSNQQKNFTIHGISPTETSTFFVSRESDIFDLSTEKIITVVYEYNYEESDQSGNITPISERHVVNIHITFKSGIPEVEDIKAPQTVLPGTLLGMREPNVTPGAYEVIGGGWELFESKTDAESHINGVDYTPENDPLYWYQDGYWVAYYAKTYLGKTYSNHEKLSVANYHDLKKVVEAKEHHYYVDIPDLKRLKRSPKIYIKDYTTNDPATSQNGLDLLKDLFDLSLLDESMVNIDEETGLITTDKSTDEDSPFKGHALLKSQVKGAANLEFFMQNDIDHGPTTIPDPEHEGETIQVDHPWTPIANDECFSGVLHGDGHTISGLAPAEGTTGSLFGKLCGSVYNLGVTGSFTGGGIADTGKEGYMENCWIKTTGTPTSGVHPLFGDPTDTDFSQVVNCYYLEDSETALYTPFSDDKNTATKKSTRSFYNGEVTYDLNGFYLYKRYSDKQSGTSDTDYKYWTSGETNPQTGYYASYPTLCSSGYRGGKYVEDRYADGDFIYAGGKIPENDDERLLLKDDGTPVLDANENLVYYPKWPDDYYFFGQILDYGYGDNPKHQDVPSTFTALNRVYRAPAYFRNSEMRAAYFNANAVFAEHKKDDETVEAYRDMTAIDFTGGNGDVAGGYKLADLDQSGKFYPPLLDDGGLTGFSNEDLTRNLLVYTSTIAPASSATNTVVSGVLTDEAYADAETDTDYHNMADRRSFGKEISGHWVEQVTTVSDGEEVKTYQAIRDHYLVDKQDFYAPIGYTFASDKCMWYQREPENYVGQLKDDNGNYLTNTGWEGVSLPFKAEIVTTNQKGEITHFYSKSWESANNSDAKIGHEYWLREFEGGSVSTENPTVFVGTFNRPTANSADGEKKYENTFLWDYYYSYNHYDDLNSDDYQEKDPTHTYYKELRTEPRTYTDYPRLANGTPYIIGFPGERYYEFDLSGQFKAETALSMPAQLGRQVITFASKKGAMIAASDLEKGKSVTEGNNTYTFQTNYLKRTFKPGTVKTYTLKADGSSYDLVPAASNAPEVTVDPVTVDAFRPYFTVEAANNNVNGVRTRSIIFSEDDAQLKGKDDRPKQEEIGGTLDIYAKRHKIIVESSLAYTVDVRIVNTAGITLNTFTIEPGETVETRVNTSGVYIVQPSEVKYTKKLAVR